MTAPQGLAAHPLTTGVPDDKTEFRPLRRAAELEIVENPLFRIVNDAEERRSAITHRHSVAMPVERPSRTRIAGAARERVYVDDLATVHDKAGVLPPKIVRLRISLAFVESYSLPRGRKPI